MPDGDLAGRARAGHRSGRGAAGGARRPRRSATSPCPSSTPTGRAARPANGCWSCSGRPPCLLVVDNCEHLVDAVADAGRRAARPLPGRPGAGHQPRAARASTARRCTRWARCRFLPRASLPADAADNAAVRLLLDRARAVDPDVAARRGGASRSCAGWTACRWRSSWPPRGCACCPPQRSPSGWPTGSGCSRAAGAPPRRGTARCAPSSSGAGTCSPRSSARSPSTSRVFASGADRGGRGRRRLPELAGRRERGRRRRRAARAGRQVAADRHADAVGHAVPDAGDAARVRHRAARRAGADHRGAGGPRAVVRRAGPRDDALLRGPAQLERTAACSTPSATTCWSALRFLGDSGRRRRRRRPRRAPELVLADPGERPGGGTLAALRARRAGRRRRRAGPARPGDGRPDVVRRGWLGPRRTAATTWWPSPTALGAVRIDHPAALILRPLLLFLADQRAGAGRRSRTR